MGFVLCGFNPNLDQTRTTHPHYIVHTVNNCPHLNSRSSKKQLGQWPMVRNNFYEAVHQPFPEGGSVPDLVRELVLHMSLPDNQEGSVVHALGGVDENVDTVKLLKESHVRFLLGFLGDDASNCMQGIKVLLGSMLMPFVFPSESATKQSTKKKGGETKSLGVILEPRRKMPDTYFPPEEFDLHRKGSIDRDESALRKLIPKEVNAPHSHTLNDASTPPLRFPPFVCR